MYIIIAGGGKIGLTLTEQLRREGHDIVLIDRDPDVIKEIITRCDVMGICGSAAICRTLQTAGVENADLVIATTPQDEINILCCIEAGRLGAKSCIARVRSPEFYEQLVFMRDELGLSMLVNPELYAADEISRMLRFPTAIKLDSFAKGRLDLAELKLAEDSPLCGRALNTLESSYRASVLVCAVARGDEVFIPDGNFVLRAGDNIHITASHSELSSFMRNIGIPGARLRNVMIVGGGNIAHYLTGQLLEAGMKVKIIENNRDRCVSLTKDFPKAEVLLADGTDQSVLLDEGVESTDACVALTGIDEENIIISMFAKKSGAGKVITKISKSTLLELLPSVGLESVISPQRITANRLIQHVRAMENTGGSGVQTLYRLVNDRVEALEFIVRDANAPYIRKTLRELKLRKNLLIASIVRGNRTIIPRGGDTIQLDDSVVVVTTNQHLSDLREILD